MIITIEHFTCTPLAKQSLLPEKLNLTRDEKEILDLIAFYEDSNLEHKTEIENIFDELSEEINLSRLVALNLLKYHIDKPKPKKAAPLIDNILNSSSSHPVQNSNASSSSQLTSSPVDAEIFTIDFDTDLSDEMANVSYHDAVSTTKSNPIINVVMGNFDDDKQS